MKKILITISILIIFLTSQSIGFAQSTTEEAAETTETLDQEYKPTAIPKPDLLPGPEFSESRSEQKFLTESLLPRIGVTLIGFAGFIGLIILIVAGIRMALSLGEEDENENAKDQIIYAIAGLLVAMLAYTIVKIVINLEFNEDTSLTTKANTHIEYIA